MIRQPSCSTLFPYTTLFRSAKILENNIAYVKIPYVAPGKTAEVRRQLDALLKKGATNVVLDLRYTAGGDDKEAVRSEEHTSELQSHSDLVCRLLLEKRRLID